MNKGDGFVLDAAMGEVSQPGAVRERHELVGRKTRLSSRNSLGSRMGSIAELREEMLVMEKYWERGIEFRGECVLDEEEFGEWGAACMSAMVMMGLDGMQFVIKSRLEALATPPIDKLSQVAGHFLSVLAE